MQCRQKLEIDPFDTYIHHSTVKVCDAHDRAPLITLEINPRSRRAFQITYMCV